MRLAALMFLALICLAHVAVAQEDTPEIPAVDFPVLPKSGASAEAFVPKGWEIEKKLSGDLNGDVREDLVLVLHDRDPKNVVVGLTFGDEPYDTNPRILAAAFANEDGTYKLAMENHSLIARPTNPGQEDPLAEGDVRIERGSLIVDLALFMSAGGWDAGHSIFRFRHEKKGFRLIGFDRMNVHRGSGDMTELSVNYLTGKVILKSGNIESDVMKETAKRLKKKPVITIADIDDGLSFEPEI